MACFSDKDITRIFKNTLKESKSFLSKKDLSKSLDSFEYKNNNGVYVKLTNDEKTELVEDYYKKYVEIFEKSTNKKAAEISNRKASKQYRDYVKSKKIASELNKGDMESYINNKVTEAYKFPKERRQRMLNELQAEIDRYEKSIWKQIVGEFAFTKPLISFKFILSSLISNRMQTAFLNKMYNKNIPKEVLDEIKLYKKILESSVFLGGVTPSSSIKASEGGKDYSISETEQIVKGKLSSYFDWMKKLTRYGGRVINYTDSNLGYHAKQVYYHVSLEKETELYKAKNGLTSLTEAQRKEINEIVFKKVFDGASNIGEAKSNSYNKIKEQYEKAGLKVIENETLNNDKEIGTNSAEFKRAVFENMFKEEDISVLTAANKFSMRAFFKGDANLIKAAQEKNSLKMVDAGLMGIISFDKMALSQVVKGVFGDKGVMVDLVLLKTVGYINGASNFAEQLLETTPYGWVKYALMKGANVDNLADQLYKKERLRQLGTRPIYSLITSAILVAMVEVANQFCKEEGDTMQTGDIADGKALNVCGYKIPTYLLGMQSANTTMLNYLYNVVQKEQEFDKKDLFAFTYMILNQRDELNSQTNIATFTKDQFLGKSYQSQERGVVENMVNGTVDLFSPFIAVPNRPINEIASFFSKDAELKKDVKFHKDFAPKFLEAPKYAAWAALQTVGLKEVVLSATNEKSLKSYDYRGRELYNGTMGASAYNGIRYDKYDDMINNLDVDEPSLLFNSPYRTLFSNDEDKSKQRYMTQKEFSNSQRAIGEYFDKIVKDNYETLSTLKKDDAKAYLKYALKRLEAQSKKVVEDNEESNYETYLNSLEVKSIDEYLENRGDDK